MRVILGLEIEDPPDDVISELQIAGVENEGITIKTAGLRFTAEVLHVEEVR